MDKAGKKRIELPEARVIAGSIAEMGNKYTAASVGLTRGVAPAQVAQDIKELADKFRAAEKLGLPEAETVAGTLDALAKKYHASSEKEFSIPEAKVIAGTLDALAKKYKGDNF